MGTCFALERWNSFPTQYLVWSLFLSKVKLQQKKPLYWGRSQNPYFLSRGWHLDIFLPKGTYLSSSHREVTAISTLPGCPCPNKKIFALFGVCIVSDSRHLSELSEHRFNFNDAKQNAFESKISQECLRPQQLQKRRRWWERRVAIDVITSSRSQLWPGSEFYS